MTDTAEIETKFWNALKDHGIVMLGLDGLEDGFARPMAAVVDEERSPIWFFASADSAIVDAAAGGGRASATLSAKGQLYASVQGRLSVTDDRQTIERLWNPGAAAWFEGGMDDPKVRLLRLDAENAEIWLDGSSIAAGVKSLLGIDPKEDYNDKQARVQL